LTSPARVKRLLSNRYFYRICCGVSWIRHLTGTTLKQGAGISAPKYIRNCL
jgi:hypothetical protein